MAPSASQNVTAIYAVPPALELGDHSDQLPAGASAAEAAAPSSGLLQWYVAGGIAVVLVAVSVVVMIRGRTTSR